MARPRAGAQSRSQDQRSRRAAAMELATPHHPDRARRLTMPARLIGAHLQLGGKIEKSSLWPRWSSLPAVRRDDSCLERNRAPRGPQRMLTIAGLSANLISSASLLFFGAVS